MVKPLLDKHFDGDPEQRRYKRDTLRVAMDLWGLDGDRFHVSRRRHDEYAEDELFCEARGPNVSRSHKEMSVASYDFMSAELAELPEEKTERAEDVARKAIDLAKSGGAHKWDKAAIQTFERVYKSNGHPQKANIQRFIAALPGFSSGQLMDSALTTGARLAQD
jgi:hypothetical protein